jgi:hypothetical protein
MTLPCITTGRQDTPRLSCRRVCFASSLGSNSTDRAAADRSRSTRHIDICWRSAGLIPSSPRPRVAQAPHHKQIGSSL